MSDNHIDYFINEEYRKLFPENCPIMEFSEYNDAENLPDPCCLSLDNGACPEHGLIEGAT